MLSFAKRCFIKCPSDVFAMNRGDVTEIQSSDWLLEQPIYFGQTCLKFRCQFYHSACRAHASKVSNQNAVRSLKSIGV